MPDNLYGIWYSSLSDDDKPYFDSVLGQYDIYDINDLRAKIKRYRSKIKEINSDLDMSIKAIDERELERDKKELIKGQKNFKNKYQKMKIPDDMLKGDNITTNDIGKNKFDETKATIIGDAEIVDKDYGNGIEKRIEITLTLDSDENGDERKLTLSKTNLTTLVNSFGDESEKWDKKRIGLILVENNIGKNPLRIEIKILKE